MIYRTTLSYRPAETISGCDNLEILCGASEVAVSSEWRASHGEFSGRMETERTSSDQTRCCEGLVQEFKPNNIGLEYENPSHFVTPQV